MDEKIYIYIYNFYKKQHHSIHSYSYMAAYFLNVEYLKVA